MRGQEPGSEHERGDFDGSAGPATPPPSFGQPQSPAPQPTPPDAPPSPTPPSRPPTNPEPPTLGPTDPEPPNSAPGDPGFSRTGFPGSAPGDPALPASAFSGSAATDPVLSSLAFNGSADDLPADVTAPVIGGGGSSDDGPATGPIPVVSGATIPVYPGPPPGLPDLPAFPGAQPWEVSGGDAGTYDWFADPEQPAEQSWHPQPDTWQPPRPSRHGAPAKPNPSDGAAASPHDAGTAPHGAGNPSDGTGTRPYGADASPHGTDTHSGGAGTSPDGNDTRSGGADASPDGAGAASDGTADPGGWTVVPGAPPWEPPPAYTAAAADMNVWPAPVSDSMPPWPAATGELDPGPGDPPPPTDDAAPPHSGTTGWPHTGTAGAPHLNDAGAPRSDDAESTEVTRGLSRSEAAPTPPMETTETFGSAEASADGETRPFDANSTLPDSQSPAPGDIPVWPPHGADPEETQRVPDLPFGPEVWAKKPTPEALPAPRQHLALPPATPTGEPTQPPTGQTPEASAQPPGTAVHPPIAPQPPGTVGQRPNAQPPGTGGQPHGTSGQPHGTSGQISGAGGQISGAGGETSGAAGQPTNAGQPPGAGGQPRHMGQPPGAGGQAPNVGQAPGGAGQAPNAGRSAGGTGPGAGRGQASSLVDQPFGGPPFSPAGQPLGPAVHPLGAGTPAQGAPQPFGTLDISTPPHGGPTFPPPGLQPPGLPPGAVPKRPGKNKKALFAVLGVLVLAGVATGGFFAYRSMTTSPPAGASAATSQPTVAPTTAKPTASPPTDAAGATILNSEQTDPQKLSLTEAFPQKKASLAGTTFTRVKTDMASSCDKAASGPFADALRTQKCSRVLRATYVDSKHRYAVTTGIAVLPSKDAALQADEAKNLGKNLWFRALPGAAGSGADRVHIAGGYAAGLVWGRYIVFSYATYADGHTPTAKERSLGKVSGAFRDQTSKVLEHRITKS